MTAPHTGGCGSIRRRPSTGEDVLHRIGIKPLSNTGGLDGGQDLSIVGGGLRRLSPAALGHINKRGRTPCRYGDVLFGRKPE